MTKLLILQTRQRHYVLLCVAFSVVINCATAQAMVAPRMRSAGSVIVDKRRIVLVRSDKLTRDFPDRKRAVINYPVIKGLRNTLALNKIRSTLQIKNIFDSSIAEYKDDAWLTSFDYSVNYNKNYILDITFTQEGVGAYPDTHTKHFAINLKSGEVIKARDVFRTSSLEILTKMINNKLQAEVKSIIEERVSNRADVEDKEQLIATFKNVKFESSNLDEFSVGDRGVTFLYDADFPHVIKGLEPEGHYFLDYKKIAPYIKPNSLLAVFVK